MKVFNSKQCAHHRWCSWMCTLIGQGVCTMLGCFRNAQYMAISRWEVTTTCLESPHTHSAHLSLHHTEIMGTYFKGKKINTLHSSNRVLIERAFGRLKGKWRWLKYLPMEDLHMVITAACLLQNFLLREEGHQMEDCEEVDGNGGNDCRAGHPENTCFIFGGGWLKFLFN